jgi:hypothetical protein
MIVTYLASGELADISDFFTCGFDVVELDSIKDKPR